MSFVLQNVRKVHGELLDLVIQYGKIIAVNHAKQEHNSQYPPSFQLIDCNGNYVSSGWIDMHTHAYSDFFPYGDHIDEIGVKQGVTTIVDAGSCGADHISDLLERAENAKTNLYAFLNISRIGLSRMDELSNMEWVNESALLRAVQDHADKIVGLKARISRSVVGENSLLPLIFARKMSDVTSLPMMVHIGSGPPSVKGIVSQLSKKDVLTHYLNGKANRLFDQTDKPLKVLTDAIERGVHLDVGHGTSSFSFRMAEAAKKHGIHFSTISTDIYRGNRLHGPVFGMANLLSKFLDLGYTLEEVIDAVTVNAATWLNKPHLGRIQVGDLANLTLFDVIDEPFMTTDSYGAQRMVSREIKPTGVVINGQFIKC